MTDAVPIIDRSTSVPAYWRVMETYDGEARRVWQERMRLREKAYLRGSVVCVSSAGSLLRMAVQAANLVASLVHGAKVELSTDLAGTLAQHNVHGPQRGK